MRVGFLTQLFPKIFYFFLFSFNEKSSSRHILMPLLRFERAELHMRTGRKELRLVALAAQVNSGRQLISSSCVRE